MKTCYALFCAVILSTGIVHAADDNQDRCDEAWLSHNWSSVSVRCGSAWTAEIFEATGYEAAVDTARQSGEVVDPNVQALASSTYFIASTDAAREAYADHILKIHNPHVMLSMAINNAKKADYFATPSSVQQIRRLEGLLRSPHFYSMKPSSMAALSP